VASLTEQVSEMLIIVKNKETIQVELLTKLVKTLIEFESEPGGPYYVDGKIDLITNAHIFELFKRLNKELPKVEIFLKNGLNKKSVLLSSIQKKEINRILTFKLDKSKDIIISSTNYKFIKQFTDTLTTNVRKVAEGYIDKVQKVDKYGEISNLSSIFYEAFADGKTLKLKLLKKLGEANFMIWVAYSIYDSIIDNDTTPDDVSVANICMRYALKTYIECSINHSIVFEYINKVDSANFWEVNNCRFAINTKSFELSKIPSNSDMVKLLQNRAIAHIIGPLCISSKLYLDEKKHIDIEQALSFYCIARQLNDDLHDWVEDYKNGRMTYILNELFRKAGIHTGKNDSKETLKKMKVIFYEYELENFCKLILSYVIKSESLLLGANPKFKDNLLIIKYIGDIKRTACNALEKHKFNKDSVLALQA
jgi:hypothetical protein